MDYRLENLSEDEFENLVNMLCQKKLGMGTVSFSKGKDGGRDGRFSGTANAYPSESNPWKGDFIIQAKHTMDYNASCSDNPFFGNKSSIINGEIEKIKTLKSDCYIDNYLIFTNRKETASRENIIKHLKKETGVIQVDIIGKETIHSWLRQHDDIAKLFKIGLYALPITLTDNEIKDIIIAFCKQIPHIKNIREIAEQDIRNISKSTKNILNNLSSDYFNSQIKSRSQVYFTQIDDFLANPQNEDILNMYYNFADELSNKIQIKRSQFDKFEDIFGILYDIIFEANKIDLKKYKRFVWIFLHHLYFNCHIGKKE